MSTLQVGLDWGHEHAQFVALSPTGQRLWARRCPVQSPALAEVVAQLRALAATHGMDRVHVGLERKTGRLVDVLQHAGFSLSFVRPAQVDDARRLVFASLAKDDLRDAHTIAWMMQGMPQALVPLAPADPADLELQRLTRSRSALVADRTALHHQIVERLREVFPELLSLADPGVQWFGALWRLVRTPAQAKTVSQAAVAALLKQHRVRKVDAAQVVEVLHGSVELGQAGTGQLELELMFERHDLLQQHITRLEQHIEQCVQALHAAQQARTAGPSDVEILRSVPGIGAVLVAVVLGEQLVRLLGADRAVCGVAPVQQTTGKAQTRGQGRVSMRYACNVHLRQALHLAVEKGTTKDAALKARYQALRSRGHSHGRACRQMADGLLRRLRAMLRERTLYTPLSCAA
jgi:transposase